MVPAVLVDTGAELSWLPAPLLESLGIERCKEWRFRQAYGTVLTRWTGGASVNLARTWTADEVVLGELGDLVLLGSRSLEGDEPPDRSGEPAVGRCGAGACRRRFVARLVVAPA